MPPISTHSKLNNPLSTVNFNNSPTNNQHQDLNLINPNTTFTDKKQGNNGSFKPPLNVYRQMQLAALNNRGAGKKTEQIDLEERG